MKTIISYLRLGSLIRTCLRDCPEIVPRLNRLDSLSLVSRQSDLATLQQSDRATFGSKISRRVGILFVVLVMSMANIGVAWGENQQHTQGVACSNPNNYPNMKINVKRYTGGGCSSWGEWEAYSMTKAGITFEGKQLFVGDYWTCNGLFNLQYQMYDMAEKWKEQYEQYAGDAVYDYYNNFVYDYDTHGYYSTLTFQKGHIYFDATGWNETDIKLTIGHANFQRYYGMTTVTGTKLYYYHLDLNDAFADAMGFGVVGNTSASDGTNWLTNVSDKASEYTGYRHYGMNNSGGDIRYLIVNKGKAGEQPDVDYDDDYTSLNSTQTFYSVVKEAGGNYTTANSKATISISSYELTSQGGTTNRTPSISTSANNTTVSACRTANTRLQIGTVATGYQFDGWWTDATSGSKVTESTDYTYNPTGENTLYARFSAKVYSITYKDQGNKDFTGTQDGAPTSHTYGAATALKIPTKSGYTFGGWFTASDCASGAVGTAAAASFGATDYTANITLYAKWYANDYSFAVTEYAETQDTYKVNDVVKTSTGGSMKYTPVDDDSNARLYHFTDQYYVRFAYKNGNYTDKSRVTVYLAKALKAGSIITATINNPGPATRGLKLQTSGGTDKATWTSNGEGNHTYKYVVTADDGLAGTSQFMLQYASGISNLVTLTVANSGSDATYTISLNGNGGTGHTSSVSATAGSSTLSASITNPAKSGYTFLGWYSGSGGTGDLVIDANGELQANTCYTGAGGIWAAGNVTLYAKWLENCYEFAPTGTIDAAISSGETVVTSSGGKMVYTPTDGGSPKLNYRGDGLDFGGDDHCYVTITLHHAMKAGTVLKALIKNPNSSATRGLSLQNISGTTKADWTSPAEGARFYTYTVVADDGLEGTNVFKLHRVNSCRLQSLTVSNCGDLMTYTVTLDSEGGSSGSESATVTYTSSTVSSITNPTKTGYTFSGWYSGDDGTDDLVINSSGVLQSSTDYTDSDGNWTYPGDVTLYAKWTANTYDITYKDCGGGDFSGSQTDAPTAHTYGTATTLKTATKAGTTFLGWYDNVACTGSAISSLGATAYTADITLYAKWTTTLYDSYFYQTYNYNNTSPVDLISNAGFPFYINTTCDNRGWSTLSAASPVTMPHDFSILDRSHTWYYLRGNKAITLTAVADVKAVHFYLWSTNTDRKITTTAKMVSGTGSDLSISDVTLSYGNDGTIREYVVNISSATGYSASNYYDYTFTFKNGESWLWGIYVEKYTHVYPTAITIDKSSTTLVEGETQTLSLTSITPDNTTVKTATWSVTSDSPAGCVTVNSTTGVVTAVSAGTATVRATVDGQTADCEVKVETCESFHGTLYSIEPTMEHNTGSDIAVGQKDNYSAYADIQRGGRIWIGNGSASAISKTDWCFYSQNDDVQVQMWSNGGYVILNLDCALRNGDTIKYVEGYNTSGNLFNGNIAITTTATRSTTYCTDGDHKYVVTDGDGLDGKDSIYLWQGTNRSAFRSLSVMRPASYILTYDANGGTGAPDAERRICTSKALSSTLPTRDGYVFKEWNTSSTGNGDSYRAGASYTMPSANTTLYAIWVEPIHQNDFYPLYATTDVGGDGDESDDKKAARATALISAADLPSYIDVGFNRAYWYSISASTIDVPEDFTGSGNRSYLYSTSGHNTITLTAANVKAVRFYGWNGSSTGTLSTTASVVCGVGTAPTYSNVTTSGTNIVVAEHTVDIAGAANYNANTLYTFTFTFSGGSWLGMYVETNDTRTLTYSATDADDNVPDAETWAPNATDHLSDTKPTRTGYTFAGWNEETDGSGATDYDAEDIYTMPLTNNTLYAKWTVDTYTITLDANEGTGGSASVTATYNSATLPEFTNPTKESNVFAGWYDGETEGNGSGNLIINNIGELQANVTGFTGDGGIWTATEGKTVHAKWITVSNVDTECWDGSIYKCGDIENFDTPKPTGSTVNWSKATWGNGSAPTAETDVALTENMIVDVTDAKAKSIVLDDEITLTVSANKSLVVTGTITRENGSPTTASDLIIRSTEDGNGTLIFENDGNEATVEMYSKATTEGEDWTWQYIGVPFTGAVAKNTYVNGYLYSFSSSGDWQVVHANDVLVPFEGYSVSYPTAGHVYSMSGVLAPTTTQEITVPASGYKVIGNSWTAPIYVKAFTEDDFSGIDVKSVYLFNTGSDVDGTASGASERYSPGTYVTIPIYAAAATGDSLIAPLQGFYVDNTSNASTATLTMDYERLVRPVGNRNTAAGAMHAPKRVTESEQEEPVVLKLWAVGSRYDDRLIILEDEHFTAAYDAGWDGEKWDSQGNQPMLYTHREDGTPDAVSAIPTIDGTSLVFRAGEDSQYTIRMEYSAENEPLYLYDIQADIYTRVETDATYTFYIHDKQAHTRFLLTRTRAPQVPTDNREWMNPDKEKAVKFIDNNRIYIFRNGVIYDATGKRVKG